MHKIVIFSVLFLLCCHFLPCQNPQYKIESISLKDCLLRSLKHNLDLEIEGYNPKIREFDLRIAHSAFDPAFTTALSVSESESPSLADDHFVESSRNVDLEIGIAKKHILGGTIGMYYELGHRKRLSGLSDSTNLAGWEHGLNLRITQPLLRNLGIEVTLTSIKIAEHERDQALYIFQDRVMTVLANVQTAYWNLVNAIANYELQRKSLELAENLYKITLARIKAGSLAAADILEAERNVASKQDGLILAEKEIYNAEDLLKQYMNPLDLKYYRDVRLVPNEIYVFKKFEVDFEGALREALLQRPDILADQLTLETTLLTIAREKNQLLPKLDLTSTVGFRGVAEKGSDAWESASQGEFLNWSVLLSLEIPIGNRAATSRYMQALLQRKQAIAQHKKLENTVILEVRDAVRELTTAMLRVETAQKTRELAEKQLANEENKFRAGIIALFQVQDTEQKLTAARINESNALLDYQRALVQLARTKGATIQEMKRYGFDLSAASPQERSY